MAVFVQESWLFFLQVLSPEYLLHYIFPGVNVRQQLIETHCYGSQLVLLRLSRIPQQSIQAIRCGLQVLQFVVFNLRPVRLPKRLHAVNDSLPQFALSILGVFAIHAFLVATIET